MILRASWLAAAWLRASPTRAAVVVISLAVTGFLPLFTLEARQLLEEGLLVRARATPLVLGARGNPFDLTLGALTFRAGLPEPLAWGDREAALPYGAVVPLHWRHTAEGTPIVGTTLDYLDQRGLTIAEGRRFATLGEVVVGAEVSRRFGLHPGAVVRNDLTNLDDLAGAYPYQLKVVGVLSPGAPEDDRTYFTDLKTAWMLDGALHGHGDPSQAPAGDQASEDEAVEVSAAIFLLQEVKPETAASFHLHGSVDGQPVHALLVFPPDQRRHDQLLGDVAANGALQAVQPEAVLRRVLDLVLQLSDLLLAYAAGVALSTLALLGLVLHLSAQTRLQELALLRRLGASRSLIAATLLIEASLVLGLGLALGGLLQAVALALLRRFLQLS